MSALFHRCDRTTLDDLSEMASDLGIRGWEMNRTHWAVKNIDLTQEQKRRNLSLPTWINDVAKTVDITTHDFNVAFSFSGGSRPLVNSIAAELEHKTGANSYFYDDNYLSQLARPSLDILLQDVYRRSKLIVVFRQETTNIRSGAGLSSV